MAIELECTVDTVYPTEQVTETFKKRELLVVVDPASQYPAQLCLTAKQAGCEKLDELRSGDVIKAYLNLEGKFFTNKTGKKQAFNNLGIWKFDVLRTVAGTSNGNTSNQGYTIPDMPDIPDDDDLPF